MILPCMYVSLSHCNNIILFSLKHQCYFTQSVHLLLTKLASKLLSLSQALPTSQQNYHTNVSLISSITHTAMLPFKHLSLKTLDSTYSISVIYSHQKLFHSFYCHFIYKVNVTAQTPVSPHYVVTLNTLSSCHSFHCLVFKLSLLKHQHHFIYISNVTL